jgi:hypothetical protein
VTGAQAQACRASSGWGRCAGVTVTPAAGESVTPSQCGIRVVTCHRDGRPAGAWALPAGQLPPGSEFESQAQSWIRVRVVNFKFPWPVSPTRTQSVLGSLSLCPPRLRPLLGTMTLLARFISSCSDLDTFLVITSTFQMLVSQVQS